MKKSGRVVVFLPRDRFTVEQLERIGSATFYGNAVVGEADLIAKCSDAEAVLATPSRINRLSAKFFDSLPKLKFVSIYATGFDWVDLKAAAKNKVIVSYCPGFATVAVAGYTISMIKRLCNPRGKTLGVIGLGRIGLAVVEKASRLGMSVITWDRKEKASFQVPFEKLLRESDVISVHLALNDETRGIIGKKELALMKKGAFLINPSRERLVDNAALSEALENGKIAGAAIDLEYNSKTKIPKAITTLHVAWRSVESETLGTEMFVHNLEAWRAGRPENRLA